MLRFDDGNADFVAVGHDATNGSFSKQTGRHAAVNGQRGARYKAGSVGQ